MWKNALENPNISSKSIDTALKSHITYVRLLAVKSPKITLDSIRRALNDPSDEVRTEANERLEELKRPVKKSEDLFKAEAPDPLETLHRLRTNFHRTKDYVQKAKQNYDAAPPTQKERAKDHLARALVSHAETEHYFNQGVASLAKQVPPKAPGEEYKFKNQKDLDLHLHTQPFALISGSRDHRTPEENDRHHNALLEDIKKLGHPYTHLQGKWGGTQEPSYMVHGIAPHEAAALSQKYDQMAHIQSDKGIHREFSHKPDYNPMPGHHGHISDEYLSDNYSEVPFVEGGKTRFRVNLEPPKAAGPSGPSGHPHGYDWHDGHTIHHEPTEKMEKTESKVHPLAQKHGASMLLPENESIVDPGPPNWKPSRMSVTRRDSHVMVPVSMLRDKGALVDTPYRTDDPKGWTASPEHMEKLKTSMQTKGFRGLIGMNVHPDGRIEISDGTHRAYMAEKLGMTHIPAEVRYVAHAESKQGLLHGPKVSDFKYQDFIPEEEFYGPRKPLPPREPFQLKTKASGDKHIDGIMELLGYDIEKAEPLFKTEPDLYQQIAKQWGVLNPVKKSDLNHYDLRPHEAKIDELIEKHGYRQYPAGGKYPKPELDKHNYNTNYLHIQDSTPESGVDHGDEALTRSWRKLHELSHALTAGKINEKYGEGRRAGRMGNEITPHEAKRALEWEWEATHKMRDLATEIGHPLVKEDFAKELNTVILGVSQAGF